MIWFLLPRRQRAIPRSLLSKLDMLQAELEKRVERLENTKAKLVSHANGALSGHAAPGEGVIIKEPK